MAAMDAESPTRRNFKEEDGQAQSPADDAATVDMNDNPEESRTNPANERPNYRSWKKKWRKLKMTFDQKMNEAERLWDQERKAETITKRIAMQNDRLLDILQDINDCAQIPPEKRILVPSVDKDEVSSDEEAENPSPLPSTLPTKTFESLAREVPHSPFATYKVSHPDFAQDVEAAPGEDEPSTFITIDEIEDYLFRIDEQLGLPKLPTLAPLARKQGDANSTIPTITSLTTTSTPGGLTRDFMLKHQHSAYNWLKRNAAHVFLQGEGDDEEGAGAGTGKKSRGANKGVDKGGAKASGGRGGSGNKRASLAKERAAAAAAAAAAGDGDVSMDDADDYQQAATAPARKRKRADEDGGYRPKGGSSRPSKKKKKGGEAGIDAGPSSSKKRRVSAAARDD